MCYPQSDFRIGQRDVYLGSIAETPFYIGERQFEYWQHTHLTIDVVPGRGGGFSLEVPEGMRFLVRSRIFTEAEYLRLADDGPAPRGEQMPSLSTATEQQK